MDRLNSTFRALFDIGHSGGCAPEWFEQAWNNIPMPTQGQLVRTLLANKRQAEARLGKEKVEAIFCEELKFFREELQRSDALRVAARDATEPLLVVPFALVRQEAVGHGCFHTGVLGTQDPLLRWVYDCGSWTKKELLKERVDQYAARLTPDRVRDRDIDLLFASHFDADHVSGLDYLLSRSRATPIRVHTVIIPYMSPEASFAVLAKAVSENNCTAELMEVVIRPVHFFASRGVKRVIFQMPKRLDGGGNPADPVLDPPPAPPRGRPPVSGLPDVLTPVFVNRDGTQLAEQVDPETKIRVANAAYGTVCGVVANDVWADWWFLPYAYEWRENHAELSNVAKQVVGLAPDEDGFNDRLSGQLQTKDGIMGVKSIFASLDSNQTSLSLYAGSQVRRGFGAAPGQQPAGWLLTGDAKLKAKARMEEWKDAFSFASGSTGHLMVPHHGAEDNFNAELLTFAGKARHFVTVNAQDDESKKRPSAAVRETSKAAKKELHVVSEREASRMSEISGPDHLNKERWLISVSNW
ncbi:hypothetical protein ACVIGA_000637 [Bradyrhizobium sp. USDA 3240]